MIRHERGFSFHGNPLSSLRYFVYRSRSHSQRRWTVLPTSWQLSGYLKSVPGSLTKRGTGCLNKIEFVTAERSGHLVAEIDLPWPLSLPIITRCFSLEEKSWQETLGWIRVVVVFIMVGVMVNRVIKLDISFVSLRPSPCRHFPFLLLFLPVDSSI